MSVDQHAGDRDLPHPEGEGSSVGRAHEKTVKQAPVPSEFDDYWAYKISEAAKKKVFAYFAVLGVVVSVAITLFGIDRIRTLIDGQFVKQLEQREEEAAQRVNDLTRDFEAELTSLQSRVEARSQEFHQVVGVTLAQVGLTSGSISGLRIDLSSEIGPIRDQGSKAATTGFSAAYALTAEAKRVSGISDVFSARSIYVEAKRRDEWPGEDYDGSSVLGAMKALKEVGAYLEIDWPYEREHEALSGRKPARRITAYSRISKDRTDLMIDALRNGKTVVVSLRVTDDFDNVNEDGKVVISADAKTIGGHSVCLVGYDGTTDEFKFANMWGKEWGSSGFGYIHRGDLQKLIMDAFTLAL